MIKRGIQVAATKGPVSLVYKTTPRVHQAEAYDKVYGLSSFALFMEQGTGKTKTTIDILSNYAIGSGEGPLINAVLLIAPNGVHEQWYDEQLPLHSPVPCVSYLWKGLPTSKVRQNALREFVLERTPGKLKWFFVNVEAFSVDSAMPIFKAYLEKNAVAVCVDEATVIKNPSAHCTTNIVQGLNDLEHQGRVVVGLTTKSIVRAVLTGTQSTNNPFDQYSYGEFLFPGFWRMNYATFKHHFGLIKQFYVHGTKRPKERLLSKEDIVRIRGQLDAGFRLKDVADKNFTSTSVVAYLQAHRECTVPYKNLQEMKERMAPFSFVKLKKDCYDLPEKQRIKVHVTLSPAQAKIYKDLIRDAHAEYEDKELDVMAKMALITRLSQVTGGFFPSNEGEKPTPIEGNGKLQALKKEIEETDERPLIVCARFTAELETIFDAFKDQGARILYGKTSAGERSETVEQFKKGAVPILVAQPKVCSMGFNFQAACNMFFYSNSFSFLIRAQMEDRIHRDGQTSDHVIYRDLIAKGTVDERILRVLEDGQDLLDYMREPISVGEFLGVNEGGER